MSIKINIIKLGGSVINPDGKYDDKVISTFIEVVRNSPERFIFIVGGGKLCRKIQAGSKKFLDVALNDSQQTKEALDWLGIAVTKVNASYVLNRFKEKLGNKVYPEIILNPTTTINSNAKVFFAGSWKSGSSTDADMMLLAETFQADRVFKISNFDYIKKMHPIVLANLSPSKKAKILAKAENIKQMTWKELIRLVGTRWVSGLNTPFDPKAAEIGYKLRKKLTLYVGKKEEIIIQLKNKKTKKFKGTIVRH